MVCSGCGNQNAYSTTSGTGWEYCNACGGKSTVYLPDVYWDGKEEKGLADGPDGKPRVFGSRMEKAVYLRERGIVEAGDRIKGAPASVLATGERRGSLDAARAEALASLRKTREMGRDYRRQQVLKMWKESQR